MNRLSLDLINKSMEDSARQVRLSLGLSPSHATMEEALQQVAMLQEAKLQAAKEK